MEAVEVRLNYAYGNPQRGLWLVRADGTEIDISWRVALMPGGMPKARLNVSSAARYEIRDQIAAARAKVGEGALCPLCGNPLKTGDMHVDHAGEWPFVRIFDEFFKNFDHFEAVRLEDATSTQLRFMDRHMSEAWQEFHREKAELVVIHANENLTKKRKA